MESKSRLQNHHIKVLYAVQNYTKANKLPPTSSAISRMVCVDSSAILNILDELEEWGYIRQHWKSIRTIQILKEIK